MPEAAEADDGHFVAFADVPVTEGGIGGDARAEEGSGGGEVEFIGDVEDEVFVYYDGCGVAAVGGSFVILLGAVVGIGAAVKAVLFQVGLAVVAMAAGVDEAAGAGQVADLELLYMASHFYYLSNDLMTGDHGEDAGEPVVLDLVEIGVAYPAELNIELYVVWPNFATFEAPGSEIGRRALCSIAFYWYHISFFRFRGKLDKLDDKKFKLGLTHLFLCKLEL
jgi:hypothetical protein